MFAHMKVSLSLRTILFSGIGILVCAVFLASCSDDKELKHFESTYSQILLVREQIRDTAVANPKVDSIMKANGYTRNSFAAAFMQFSRNNESFRKMMDSVHSKVQRPQ